MQVDPFAGFQFNWGHCYSIYVTYPTGRAIEGEKPRADDVHLTYDGWEGGLLCAYRAGRSEAVSRHQTTRLSKIVRVVGCYR